MDNEVNTVVAKVAMVGGASAGGAGYLTLNDLLLIGGFAVAVGGFLVNWYYNWKDDKRKELEHRWRLREASPTGLNSPTEL